MLLQGLTAFLSLPASWDNEVGKAWDGRQLAAELRRVWEECTDELERQAAYGPGSRVPANIAGAHCYLQDSYPNLGKWARMHSSGAQV